VLEWESLRGLARDTPMTFLNKIGMGMWIVGTILVVLSWIIGTVTAAVGWAGFIVALMGAVLTRLPASQQQASYPESPEGKPVAPTGIWVQPDTPLEPGSRVLAHSRGQWWRARVIALEDGDRVRLNFLGWDPNWEESHRRSQLQLDADVSMPPKEQAPQQAPSTGITRYD
jgi:hypothetical protein